MHGVLRLEECAVPRNGLYLNKTKRALFLGNDINLSKNLAIIAEFHTKPFSFKKLARKVLTNLSDIHRMILIYLPALLRKALQAGECILMIRMATDKNKRSAMFRMKPTYQCYTRNINEMFH